MRLDHTSERSPREPRARIDVPELYFPSEEPFEEHVAETIRHFEARTTLYETLKEAFEDVSVGSDQFVYYDSTNPKKCLAPDVFVKLDSRDRDFDSWMAWVRGTPDLAVEIVSDSDRLKLSWEEKFARYEAVGIQEVVRFDPRRDNAATACRAQTVRGSRCASTSGGGGQATACRSGTTA